MSLTEPFDPPAIVQLRKRTEYEAWLLEAIYRITNQRITVEGFDQLVYPPTGAPPTQTIFGIASIDMGDWRPGFLKVGAPLVFVMAFKLIDMIWEWVLEENGKASTFRFAQKLKALQEPIQFPAILDSRPWLCSRLVSLYSNLEPLRGTIIHERYFETSEGALSVSSSKFGNVRPPVSISAQDLRTLSAVFVSMLRYLEGSWTLDQFGEKRLRYLLDRLIHLHNEPLLGQQEPTFLNARLYAKKEDVIKIDIDRIRRDATAGRAHQEVLFDIRLVAIDTSRYCARAFLIPWSLIENQASPLTVSLADLDSLECPLPSDVDVNALATQMMDDPPGF